MVCNLQPIVVCTMLKIFTMKVVFFTQSICFCYYKYRIVKVIFAGELCICNLLLIACSLSQEYVDDIKIVFVMVADA